MRKLLKRITLYLCFIPASPFIAIAYLGSIIGLKDIFNACSTILSLIPGKIGSFVRVAYYLGTLEEMSADVFIDFGSFFSHPTARVGRNVTIGAYCILGTVTIGDNVLIGSRVSIPSGKYQHGSSIIRAEEIEEIQYDRIIIGDRSWIGEGAILMANIGSDVIIGGGSVVTRSIPENRVALGNPARPVVKRKEN
jgi:acetyltransferase-like isoleucine patch superfamily enzyme